MKIAIFGASGALGCECARQSLAAGHAVSVLARNPGRLADDVRAQCEVVLGDALDPEAVAKVLATGTEAVLFAIGIDKHSPEDLCTDATRHILASMRESGVKRLVWCGGGSTLLDADLITFGARFVAWFARTFMGLRHRDKEHQFALLQTARDIGWIGVRPLQMTAGPPRGEYRLGYHAFSGLSKIHFPDCAHAMVAMLSDDTWLHEAPIIQY